MANGTSSPVAFRPRSWSRAVLLCLAVLPLGGVAGCGNGDVWIYVDNTTTEPITVTVEDKKEATVAPDKFEIVKCQPGKKRFLIERGTSVLYSGTKDIKESEKWGTARKYLFNPDGRNCYVTYVVKYGSSRLEGLIQAALESQSDRAGAVRAAYAKLSKEVTLHPSDLWIDISAAQYVLIPPPDSVRTKSSTATRTALTRVERRDYAKLEAALGKRDPTERDLEDLDEAIEIVLDSAP